MNWHSSHCYQWKIYWGMNLGLTVTHTNMQATQTQTHTQGINTTKFAHNMKKVFRYYLYILKNQFPKSDTVNCALQQ